MNLKDVQKTLQSILSEMEEEITSKEQYIAAKKRLDELREEVRKNPFIAMLSDTIITPVSREIERAYKAFISSSDQPSYEGFDLVNDPKAMEKVRQYLDTLEASSSSMTPQQLKGALDPLVKLSDDLKHLKPESNEEQLFAKETIQRVLKLVKDVEKAQTASETIRVYTDEPEVQNAAPAAGDSGKRDTIKIFTEVEYEYRYQETPFDIFADDFIEKYRTYLEDVALNSSNKKVPELLKDGKTLKIIADDLRDLIPQTDEEEDFLNEVQIQTPLLLKIVDRNIAQKSAAAKPSTPSSSPKAKKAPSRSSKPTTADKKPSKIAAKTVSKSVKKEASKPAVKKAKVK